MIIERIRELYAVFLRRVKIPFYKLAFRHIGSRWSYLQLKGKVLVAFRDAMLTSMRYHQSLCNAGLIREEGMYVCVVKNQTFSFCNEMKGIVADTLGNHSDKDLKCLFRAEFSTEWALEDVQEIRAQVNGINVGNEDGLEDARLFRFLGNVWMYATVNGHNKTSWPVLGRLEENHAVLRKPKYEVPTPQKNWMPFEWNNRLYLEYSVNPHIVLRYHIDTDKCVCAGSNPVVCGFAIFEIHGGAPALRYDEDNFLGLANTQERFWYQERYYGAVFYLFDAKPPFRINRMTKPFRIKGRSERINYITGMEFSEERDHLILSIGVSDCDNVVVCLPMSSVLNALKPVTYEANPYESPGTEQGRIAEAVSS